MTPEQLQPCALCGCDLTTKITERFFRLRIQPYYFDDNAVWQHSIGAVTDQPVAVRDGEESTTLICDTCAQTRAQFN